MKPPRCPTHNVRLICRPCELGKIGRAANEGMTPEARSHRARKAALVRWSRVRTANKAAQRGREEDER